MDFWLDLPEKWIVSSAQPGTTKASIENGLGGFKLAVPLRVAMHRIVFPPLRYTWPHGGTLDVAMVALRSTVVCSPKSVRRNFFFLPDDSCLLSRFVN